MADLSCAADWEWIASRLGPAEELERSARESGALIRRREVRDARSLLRLCLGYGCGLSLREAAAWAGMTGIARLSDVAVLKRLRGAADWLGGLAGGVVAARLPRLTEARPIRLVDGSMVRGPGGGLWRLHVAYDPAGQRFSHIELTDQRGAETLERAPVEAGEIRVGDRCYARPEGVRHLSANGGDFVLRVGWKSLYLRRPDGARLDVPALVDMIGSDAPVEIEVDIVNGRKRSLPPIRARLIILRKPPEAAARSRARARSASRRGGNRVQPQTLRTADVVMLVTSLDQARYPAADVLAIYRLRWQVELAFKRLKSLLEFNKLPARDASLARSWLFAKLLLALLLEDLDQDLLDAPPCANHDQAPVAVATDQDALPDPRRSHPRRVDLRPAQIPSAMVAARPRRTPPISPRPCRTKAKLAPMGSSPG